MCTRMPEQSRDKKRYRNCGLAAYNKRSIGRYQKAPAVHIQGVFEQRLPSVLREPETKLSKQVLHKFLEGSFEPISCCHGIQVCCRRVGHFFSHRLENILGHFLRFTRIMHSCRNPIHIIQISAIAEVLFPVGTSPACGIHGTRSHPFQVQARVSPSQNFSYLINFCSYFSRQQKRLCSASCDFSQHLFRVL
jgi:hypothetical protein